MKTWLTAIGISVALALALAVIFFITVASLLPVESPSGAPKPSPAPAPKPSPAPAPKPSPRLQVTGEQSFSVAYGSGGSISTTRASGTWLTDVERTSLGRFVATVTDLTGREDAEVSCEISDGSAEVIRRTATGPYSMAICTY